MKDVLNKIAFKDTQKHDMECKYKILNCRNNCGAQFERRLEDEHFDKCELQMIRCPYYEMGCKIEILRKDNLSHLQKEAFNHSVIFIEGQNKKNDEIKNIRKELKEVQTSCEEKINFLFKTLNLKVEEEEEIEPKLEPLPLHLTDMKNNMHREENLKQEKYGNIFEKKGPKNHLLKKDYLELSSSFSNSLNNEDDVEDYIDDEFESDYSFGFKN